MAAYCHTSKSTGRQCPTSLAGKLLVQSCQLSSKQCRHTTIHLQKHRAGLHRLSALHWQYRAPQVLYKSHIDV
jgi:hypothetical protein